MNKLIETGVRVYALFERAVSYLQSPLLLAVRLYWGWQLAQSGWGKLHNLDNVAQYFASLNMPMPAKMAFFISCVELFGGIFLALGLWRRAILYVVILYVVPARPDRRPIS